MATLDERVALLEANLHRLIVIVERLVGVEVPEREAAPEQPARDTVEWAAFLGDHPELEKPTRLEFTDEEVLAALRTACEAGTRRCEQLHRAPAFSKHVAERCRLRDRALSVDVAWEIAGWLPTRGERIRVGQALGRLARAGRCADVRRRGETTATWAVVPDAG